MGFFGFFKRKSPKNSLSEQQTELMNKMAVLLFGGIDQMRSQIDELSELYNGRHSAGDVANVLTWMTMRFKDEGDKSIAAIVDNGQMCRSNNKFNREDAIIAYKYIAKKCLANSFPDADNGVFNMMMESLGNNEDGATTDVIPGAYGEYGLCATNPIPTRGIPSNEAYLQRLALASGESFYWNRIGSFGAPNIEHPIDGYDIITDTGKKICTIFISPYHNVISRKAPKGFYLR